MRLRVKWPRSPASWVVSPAGTEHAIEVICTEVDADPPEAAQVRLGHRGALQDIALTQELVDGRRAYRGTATIHTGHVMPRAYRFSAEGAAPEVVHLIPRASWFLSLALLLLCAGALTHATEYVRPALAAPADGWLALLALVGIEAGGGVLATVFRQVKLKIVQPDRERLPLWGVGRSWIATAIVCMAVVGTVLSSISWIASDGMVAVCNRTELEETIHATLPDQTLPPHQLVVFRTSPDELLRRGRSTDIGKSAWKAGSRLCMKGKGATGCVATGPECGGPGRLQIAPAQLDVGCRRRRLQGLDAEHWLEPPGGSKTVERCGEGKLCQTLEADCSGSDEVVLEFGAGLICSGRCRPPNGKLSGITWTPTLPAGAFDDLGTCDGRRLTIPAHAGSLELTVQRSEEGVGSEPGSGEGPLLELDILPSERATTFATHCPADGGPCQLVVDHTTGGKTTLRCESGPPHLALFPFTVVGTSNDPMRRLTVAGEGWKSTATFEAPLTTKPNLWVCAGIDEPSSSCAEPRAPTVVAYPASAKVELSAPIEALVVPGDLVPATLEVVGEAEDDDGGTLRCEVPSGLRARKWRLGPVATPLDAAVKEATLTHDSGTLTWTATWTADEATARIWDCAPEDVEPTTVTVSFIGEEGGTPPTTGVLTEQGLEVDLPVRIRRPTPGKKCCVKARRLSKMTCPADLGRCTKFGQSRARKHKAMYPNRADCHTIWECTP